MTLSSETDPVETVRLILDNAANSDWPSSTPPDRIQRMEDSRPSERTSDVRRAQVSVYVWSPEVGTFETFSADADRLDQTEIVRAQVWAGDADTMNNYVSSVVSIVFGYADDNQQSTEWYDIEPQENEDFSASNFQTASGFAINAVQVRLRRNAAP